MHSSKTQYLSHLLLNSHAASSPNRNDSIVDARTTVLSQQYNVVADGLRLDGPGKCSYLTELSFIVSVSVSQNVEEVCVL